MWAGNQKVHAGYDKKGGKSQVLRVCKKIPKLEQFNNQRRKTVIRFSLAQTSAVITNVNNRLEKHGPDEKQVGFDIDIVASVPIDVLNDLAYGSHIDYGNFLYDEKGMPKQSGIINLVFDRKYEEHRFKLAMDNVSNECQVFPEATIKKFSAQPDANKMVKLKFQVQCHPTDDALLFLRQAQIKDSVLVEIEEPSQQDLLDDEKED